MINQAFCDRVVIVAAKFLVHCCCGSDVIPGRLIHGITIRLRYWTVYVRNGAAEVRRAFRAWPLAWPSRSAPPGPSPARAVRRTTTTTPVRNIKADRPWTVPSVS